MPELRMGRLTFLAISAALAGAAAAFSQSCAATIAAINYDQPGQMAKLPDGRRLNLRCIGTGSPVVILESGFGAGASAWSKVQPKVAARTRVCSYDRAGYGFSDPGPMPRHGEAIARDLDQGLAALGVRGPYVLVGHSAGGLYAQLFAGRRRGEVAGMVLVDPSVAYQDRRLAALFGEGAGSVQPILGRVKRCLAAAEKGETGLRYPAFAECAPPNWSALARAQAAKPSLWRTQASELETLFNQTSDQRARLGAVISNVPVVVLTASSTGEPATSEQRGPQAWEAMHRELAASFTQGLQRPVKSGHLMMNEQPDVVADAVLELVGATRHATGRAPSAWRGN